ncbi:MAG: hypothetical protein DRO13_05025 [Thermoprotei archaeon]|nr:MAG: hypothetical protein DRO13_05025 [Thermoprotei archaeon]
MEKIPLIVRLSEARALSDEVRVFILDLLSKKPMSVHEIAEELEKKGMYKNINTIRYHIQVLKEAGLIELVTTKEVKGGVLKYYAAKRKVYPVEVPEDIEEKLQPVVRQAYSDLKRVVLNLMNKHRDTIVEVAKKLKPCPYCITKHSAEYVVLDALRCALGRVISDPEVKSELEKFEVEEV